jgi:hypothetical protein
VAELVTSLGEFLREDAAKPWQPGDVDCCMFLASWAMSLGYQDPARHLRGTYDSEVGFRVIIDTAGGVVPVVAVCIANIEGRPIETPTAGAVGVIGSATNIRRQWGAIFDGRQWLVRAKTGTLALSAPPLAIWEI